MSSPNELQFLLGRKLVTLNPQTQLLLPSDTGSAESANSINAGIISGR